MKVISFSLWGNNPKYCTGAVKNALLASTIYPDWECWFYVPELSRITASPHNNLVMAINQLERLPNTKVIRMNEPQDWRGMFWRFLPGLDPQVEAFISRDCDSRLSLREKAAVDEWMASGELIHCMRDHPHHSVPILGGMWGMKHGAIPDYAEILERFKKEDRLQTDQEFLAQYVFTATRRIMQHDNGFFTHFWGGRPFPVPRQGLEFVGQVFDENDITVAEHQEMLRRYLR